jgi:hypothetical protein
MEELLLPAVELILGRQIHTAEPLVPEHSYSELRILLKIENDINHHVLMKF